MAVMAAGRPRLSVVIPCLGHARELVFCLAALQKQSGEALFETIVVNSGGDPAVQAAAADSPGVRLIPTTAQLSAGAARNLGAKHARSDLLGFLDADCIPETGWISAAIGALEGGALAASGPILDVLPWNLIAGSDNRLQFVDFPRSRPPGTHPYLPGAHLAMARSALEASGGFDVHSAVAQDVLLTIPLAAGEPDRVRFCTDMVVRHWGRRNWPDFLAHQYGFGYGRAVHHLRMDGSYFWLGRHASMSWLVFLRRLAYISLRVVQWNTLDLPRFVLQMPVLLFGLAAWVRGFYAGTRMQAVGQNSGRERRRSAS